MRTREELIRDMKTMETYMALKIKQRDWHGVADCAMDLREMEVELRLMDKGVEK